MHDLLAFPVLFVLGLVGWGVFSLLRAPVPPLLGALMVIGALRVVEAPIPPAPELLDPLVQILLGLFIGSKVTRETVADLKNLVRPALIVAAWALLLVFVFGPILGRVSALDSVTAVLASSVGGLPEMMVLSMATGADVAAVAVVKLTRAIIIISIFPVLFRRLFAEAGAAAAPGGEDGSRAGAGGETRRRAATPVSYSDEPDTVGAADWKSEMRSLHQRPLELPFTFAVALIGAYIFSRLGVPAGLMVGSMLFVAVASSLGLPVRGFPPSFFNPLLVALGIMVSQHFGPETADTLASGGLLWPLILSTAVVFVTALGVALLIHRLAGWDRPLSFLAAAPGGFTVMTALAIHYGYDPFRVSMIHLARLLAIKSVVPIVFAFLL